MLSLLKLLPALLLTAPCFASTYELSESCAKIEGQHVVRFHGQAFPFSMMTYDLEVSFQKYGPGLSFKTNFGIPNLSAELNTQALVTSFSEYFVIPHLHVYECNAQPEVCLHVAQAYLKHFMVAERGLAWPVNPAAPEVLACGMERIRLFNKKVRGEVMQQRIVQ